MTGRILFEPADAAGIARATLRHDGKHNAISVQMWHALRARFEALQRDPGATRVVIVAGHGGHFAAGADIEEFPSFRFDEATLREYHEETVAPALEALLACEVPLVAQVDGACVGGGLEVAACCDIRVAARNARFGIPIAKLGFPMAPGEVLAMTRVIPVPVLRELLLEARLVDADGALARGLVHRVVDDAAAEALATAQRIARGSPHAARLNKRTLRQWAQGTLDAAVREAHFAYAAHHEHRAGIQAFLAKEPPEF
jgi:enoyl-CoA hydratase